MARLQCDWSTRADKLCVALFLVLINTNDLKGIFIRSGLVRLEVDYNIFEHNFFFSFLFRILIGSLAITASTAFVFGILEIVLLGLYIKRHHNAPADTSTEVSCVFLTFFPLGQE